VNKAVGYLTGEAADPNLNLICGQNVQVTPGDTPPAALYQVEGPGLAGTSNSIPRSEGDRPLQFPQAVAPGNFRVPPAGSGKAVAGFSLNVRWEESNLTQVDPARIEGVFGPNSVLPASRAQSWRDLLKGARQPVEALPALLLLVLLA